MFRPFPRVVAGSLFALCGIAAFAADEDRLELLGRLIRDPSPKVRVEALRALARIPSARSAELALSVLDQPMDATLDYALWLTINDLSETWIATVQSGSWRPEGHEKQLEFTLRALKPEQVARVLGIVLGDAPLARDGAGPWIDVIGIAGSPRHLRRLLDQAVAGGFDDAATARALKALADAARLRQQRPDGDLAVIAPFFRHASGAVRLEAVRLAGLWKDIGTALPSLMTDVAAAPGVPPGERAAAFESLRQIGGDGVVKGLSELATGDGAPEVRRSAAVALAALDATRGFPAVVRAAAGIKEAPEALDLWRGVLSIKGASQPLREALEGHTISEDVARAGMRVAREGGRDDLELVAAFATSGGLEAETGRLTGEWVKDFSTRAMAQGDPRRGERVYRRSDLSCTTCHAIGGAGGKVGPDMTSVGASAPPDYLVESLMLPNAKIKEGYHAVVVETKDGEEVTGTLARETQEELFLRNATGQEIAVPKTAIARRDMGKLSLMPSGLLDPLTEQDRLDLVSFLSRLGKPGEFDASKGGVARRWFLGNVIHTDIQNNATDWIWTLPFADKRWVGVYSLVNGSLSPDLIEQASKAQAWTSKVAVVAATEIDQAAAGTVRFKLSTPDAEVWMDGGRLGAGTEVSAEVPPGRHRVLVKLDPRRLPDGLRLEGDGASFVAN